MSRPGSVPMDEIQKRVLRVATKKPLTAGELCEKLAKKGHNHTPRGIGRTLGVMAKKKVLIKSNERVPRYSKP